MQIEGNKSEVVISCNYYEGNITLIQDNNKHGRMLYATVDFNSNKFNI